MAVPMAALPEHERPRERLAAQGSGALSDRELLALVLRNGTRGESALDLASGLLADYGTLAALAAALPEELERRPGVGAAKSAALVAAFQLGRRAATPVPTGLVLRSPEDVVNAAQSQLVGAVANVWSSSCATEPTGFAKRSSSRKGRLIARSSPSGRSSTRCCATMARPSRSRTTTPAGIRHPAMPIFEPLQNWSRPRIRWGFASSIM